MAALNRPARILLLEDDDLLGPTLARLLRRRGYGVTLCATIGAANHALVTCPDIIVCDREVPDGDAWQWAYRRPIPAHYAFMSGAPTEQTHPFFHKGCDPIEKLFFLVKSVETD